MQENPAFAIHLHRARQHVALRIAPERLHLVRRVGMVDALDALRDDRAFV